MSPQSRLPAVLLTRPAAQGDRFADVLRARFGADLRIVTAPLLEPAFLAPDPRPGHAAALIFTSETGVAAAVRLARDGPHDWPAEAWCVGGRTADAAAAAGFRARSAGGDAGDLIRAILDARPPGPLLHLRGREARGDVAATLTAAGVPTCEAIAYAQEPRPLSAAAVLLLAGPDPVVAPVFSPRTAVLLGAERDRLALPARVRLVALSATVACAFAGRPDDALRIAARPDAPAMLDAVALTLGTA